MEHSQDTGPVNSPAIGGNWLLAAPRPTPARVPTADERAAIRAVQAMPGKIDRTICGVCGERAWTMVPLSGLCLSCYGEWLESRSAA